MAQVTQRTGRKIFRRREKDPEKFGSLEKFTSGLGGDEKPDSERVQEMANADPDAGLAMTEQDRINQLRSRTTQ